MFEVRQRWPDALFHRIEEGEMFVYRDREAFQQGRTSEETFHDVIHVVMGSEVLTLATGGEPTEAARVGQEVFTALQGLREG